MLNDVHGLWVVPAVSSPLQNHVYIAYFDDVATFHTTPYITTVYATSQTEPTPSIFDATSQTSLDFDEIEPLASVFNSTTQNTPWWDTGLGLENTFFKKLSILLDIRVALHRTTQNQSRLCLYDQNWWTYWAHLNATQILILSQKGSRARIIENSNNNSEKKMAIRSFGRLLGCFAIGEK